MTHGFAIHQQKALTKIRSPFPLNLLGSLLATKAMAPTPITSLQNTNRNFRIFPLPILLVFCWDRWKPLGWWYRQTGWIRLLLSVYPSNTIIKFSYLNWTGNFKIDQTARRPYYRQSQSLPSQWYVPHGSFNNTFLCPWDYTSCIEFRQ